MENIGLCTILYTYMYIYTEQVLFHICNFFFLLIRLIIFMTTFHTIFIVLISCYPFSSTAEHYSLLLNLCTSCICVCVCVLIFVWAEIVVFPVFPNIFCFSFVRFGIFLAVFCILLFNWFI